ncbi:hypothetical protein HDU76_013584 [Blyttiomyces sp. JEL0837]|nr:hypothetical protein HDU76_013584 [Blyttiomyces sp. JEL0837]
MLKQSDSPQNNNYHILNHRLTTHSILNLIFLISLLVSLPKPTTSKKHSNSHPHAGSRKDLTAPGIPPGDNTFILGSWLNINEYAPDFDSPSSWNSRTGYPTGSFQFRQSIPPIVDPGTGLPVLINLGWLNDGTDASVFVTIYADQDRDGLHGLDLITDSELTNLAVQLANITATTGRTVFMRYLPEMNGDWMLYGVQPDKFVQNWQKMAQIFRLYAPNVILVWSPNFDLGHRGDDNGDQPYWPGSEHVDWVGTSQYWKASQSVFSGGTFGGNVPIPDGYFTDQINYVYKTYAEQYNKPFVLSESSAAWEKPLKGSGPEDSASQDEVQYIFNSLDEYPLFMMAQVFEYSKPEDGFERDFRVSWNPKVKNRFIDAMKPLIDQNRIAWAYPVTTTTINPTINNITTSVPSLSTKTNPNFKFATVRVKPKHSTTTTTTTTKDDGGDGSSSGGDDGNSEKGSVKKSFMGYSGSRKDVSSGVYARRWGDSGSIRLSWVVCGFLILMGFVVF